MPDSVLLSVGNGDITFDCFVQACVTLSTLTKSFRARDYEGRGSIQINYEDVSCCSVREIMCEITHALYNKVSDLGH